MTANLKFTDWSDAIASPPLLWCVDLGEGAGVMECCARFAADAAIEGWPVWLKGCGYRPAWCLLHDEFRRVDEIGRPRWWREMIYGRGG